MLVVNGAMCFGRALACTTLLYLSGMNAEQLRYHQQLGRTTAIVATRKLFLELYHHHKR